MLDIEQLKKGKLYVPTISLKEGLRKTYEWYIDQKPNLNDPRMDKIDEVVTN